MGKTTSTARTPDPHGARARKRTPARPAAKAPSVWVDLRPPAAQRRAIAALGTVPADDVHATAVYLGRTDALPADVEARALRALAAVGRMFAPFEARTAGLGRFPDPAGEVVYVALASRELRALRAALVDALSREGVEVDRTHRFVPHMTVGKVAAGARWPRREPALAPVSFRGVTLWVGRRGTTVPLTGGGARGASRPTKANGDEPSTPRAALYVVGQTDTFRETAAPFVMEERTAASGRSYSVKVYLPAAYTARHMRVSDETKRLVRWVVRLSDGRSVSRDGALRVRDPGAWDRLRPQIARLRGEKREQAIADALWDALSPDEREAMVAAVDLRAYTAGRSIREAFEALSADLIAEGSPLARVAAGWHDRLRDVYATDAIGGPVGSDAWRAMTWPRWLAYVYAVAGREAPDAADLPATELSRATRSQVLAPWWGSLGSFVRQAPVPHARQVLAELTARAGGPVDPMEAAPFPPVSRLDDRRLVNEMRDARVSRMHPAWRASAHVVARDATPLLADAARTLAHR